MANANSVHSRTPEAFGNYKVTGARGVNVAATGNAIVSLPILDGGLTNSGANATSGVAIVRRITVGNYSGGSLANLNVSVGWTNDGGNLVAAAQLLTISNNQYQDLTLNATANNTFINGNVSSVLYFNVVANAVANATIDLFVAGDVFKA